MGKSIDTKIIRFALYVSSNINGNKQALSTPKNTVGPIDQPYCSTLKFKAINNNNQANGLKEITTILDKLNLANIGESICFLCFSIAKQNKVILTKHRLINKIINLFPSMLLVLK